MTDNDYLINKSKYDLAALDHVRIVRRNLFIFYLASLILLSIAETILLVTFFVTYGQDNLISERIMVPTTIVLPSIMAIFVIFMIVDLIKLKLTNNKILTARKILKVDKIELKNKTVKQ